jgi:hypothetical protein
MRLGRSCGKLNTNLGEYVNTTNILTTTDATSSNRIPWTVIIICNVSCMILLFSIRVLLARENKRRDAEPPDDTYENVYLVRINDEGKSEEVKVSKVLVHFFLPNAIANLCGSMNRSC